MSSPELQKTNSPKMAGPEKSPGKKSRNPMVVLLFYSIMMVTLPIMSFFATQYVVERYMDVSTSRSYIYATATSVVVVHIILALFVYYAYKEDKVVPIPEKED